MICLQCDNEEFVLKPDAVVQQEFRKEMLDVQTPAFACTKCGWITLTLEQTEELRLRTADAYRKKHGLLTSDAIKAIRQVMGKTQREYAAHLRVGEASVKRWETWLVQEKANDELMRLKFGEFIREQNPKEPKPTVSVSYVIEWPLSDQAHAVMPWTVSVGPIHIQPLHSATLMAQVAGLRWGAQTEIDKHMLLALSAGCAAKAPDEYGPSPPRAGGEAAFSFSTSSTRVDQRRALRKKMLVPDPKMKSGSSISR